MNLFRVSPQRQERICFRRLRRYLVSEIGRYHPFLRRRYRAAGVDVRAIRTPADLARLPLVHKQDLRKHYVDFILQPTAPGRPSPAGTAPPSAAKAAKFFVQSLLNVPRDPARLFRKTGFAEKLKRRALLEYYPIHFHVSAGTTGAPVLVAYSHWDLSHIVPLLACGSFCQADRPDPGQVRLEFTDRVVLVKPTVANSDKGAVGPCHHNVEFSQIPSAAHHSPVCVSRHF